MGKTLRELVYDPTTEMPARIPHFCGDFEGGNLGQVFLTGTRRYELHLLADPSSHYSALWYFFRVEKLLPGEYHFRIVGFFRMAPLHQYGVQPTALSMNALRSGIGWQRFGDDLNFWKAKERGVFCLSFTFQVKETDTMYFAYLYPYTYSELRAWLQRSPIEVSVLCKSHGGVDVPVVFWDAEAQKCCDIRSIPVPPRGSREVKRPLIVIAARHHPGESVASYTMEGFMSSLFAGSCLLQHFSFLLMPMINVDGVICGYYRPSLAGYDMNRSWISPGRKRNPVEYATLQLIDMLVRSRPFLFFMDFHGHSAQSNVFTYGVYDRAVRGNDFEAIFPSLMAKQTTLFDKDGGCSLTPDGYAATMRVGLHNRYKIPFSYTMEASFGALDIGPRSFTQLTPDAYREVGGAAAAAIASMLLDHIPLRTIVDAYVPPVGRAARDGIGDST